MNLQRRYDFDFTEQDDMDLRKLANDQQKQIGATIHMCLPSLKRSDD